MTTGLVWHELYMWHDTGRATTASDVYSLAVTLFNLVTAEWPFPGPTLHDLAEQSEHGLSADDPYFQSTDDKPATLLPPVIMRSMVQDRAGRVRLRRQRRGRPARVAAPCHVSLAPGRPSAERAGVGVHPSR